MNILLKLIAGLISGIIGSMGMGGGGVLVIWLTVFENFEQMKAQGTNLMFFLPIAALSLVVYFKRKVIGIRRNLPLILWGLAGCLPGFLLAGAIKSTLLGKVFGLGLVILGISEFIPKKKDGKRP